MESMNINPVIAHADISSAVASEPLPSLRADEFSISQQIGLLERAGAGKDDLGREALGILGQALTIVVDALNKGQTYPTPEQASQIGDDTKYSLASDLVLVAANPDLPSNLYDPLMVAADALYAMDPIP